MRIIEIDEREDIYKPYADEREDIYKPYATEASYRVSIELEYPEVIITRKYFYYGYYEHSNDFDSFWYNNTSNQLQCSSCITQVGNLNKASFITRKFDPEYLKIKEKELIEAFYNKLIQHEKDLEEERDNVVIDYNERIKKCQENIKNQFFIKLNRNKKLKKIF